MGEAVPAASRRGIVILLLLLTSITWANLVVRAAELTSDTSLAFDRYVTITEARLDAELRRGFFLSIDNLPDERRAAAYEQLRRGDLPIRRQEARDQNRRITVPGGLVHHWTGITFIPGATLKATVDLLQDYDRHQDTFHEVVSRSRLLARQGDRFTASLQLTFKKMLTGVINTDNDVVYRSLDATHVYVQSRSIRAAEVVEVNTPREHELPASRDNGYLWRANSYWKLQETRGGTYLECEWLSLSRSIPLAVRWLVEPLVIGMTRDALRSTLLAARTTLSNPPSSAGPPGKGHP